MTQRRHSNTHKKKGPRRSVNPNEASPASASFETVKIRTAPSSPFALDMPLIPPRSTDPLLRSDTNAMNPIYLSVDPIEKPPLLLPPLPPKPKPPLPPKHDLPPIPPRRPPK